jgi:glycosyltransferase involved in cell wall biosynthesis
MEADVRRAADELGVASSVDVLGFVEDTEGLLEGTSILLATAPGEPFGLAVVEAMSRGIPVVAADAGAHRETVGDATLLFPPGQPRAAAELLEALASSPEARRVQGAELQARQRALFTVETHVDGLERVYDAIIGRQVRS